MKSQTNKKDKIMKERFLEKFIMMEFVKGNLDSQEQVNDMVFFDTEKVGRISGECRKFFKKRNRY